MELRTPADQLWFCTTHLECRGNKGTQVGTGFFYALNGKRKSTGETGPIFFMVTNRHIAEVANDRMLIHLIKGAETAGKVRKPLLGERVGINLSDPLPAFFFHPDESVDVAVLPFNKYMDELVEAGGTPMITSVAAEESLTADKAEELDSLEQIIVVGYPDGLYDSHNLTPIVRTGYTASPIRLDYGGRPTFLIDAPIFPGSSGSPVFLMERFGQVAGAFGGAGRVVLLGLVAEVHTTRAANLGGTAQVRGKKAPKNASNLMDLGIVYKASTVDECVDTVFAKEGIERIPSPEA